MRVSRNASHSAQIWIKRGGIFEFNKFFVLTLLLVTVLLVILSDHEIAGLVFGGPDLHIRVFAGIIFYP